MSTMEDTKELEAWDRYANKMQRPPLHEIRSHRAPRMPSAFPIRRILMVLTILTMAATFINASTVQRRPDRSHALATPAAIMAPQTIPVVPDTTTRVDTGSEVDTDPRSTTRSGRSSDERKIIPPPMPRVEAAVAYALAQQGDRYSWAKAGPNAFDCSGLVLAAFKQIGISLPHFTGTMMSKGTKVSKAGMQRGDIVFPSSGHVGIYLGNGMMVHASSSKGKVVVAKVYGFYTARRLV